MRMRNITCLFLSSRRVSLRRIGEQRCGFPSKVLWYTPTLNCLQSVHYRTLFWEFKAQAWRKQSFHLDEAVTALNCTACVLQTTRTNKSHHYHHHYNMLIPLFPTANEHPLSLGITDTLMYCYSI